MTEAREPNEGTEHIGAPDASALAADALRLIGTAQEWARQTFAEVSTAADEHTTGHSSDCQWCPLCQFVAVLRGERPELTERVAEAGAALAAALRAALDTATHAPSGQHRAEPGAQRAPRVQRIDLGGGAPDADWAAPE